MSELIPAILVSDALKFQEKLSLLEGQVIEAQIDIMDGRFVPQTTFGDPAEISSFQTSINYELHLMVEDPEAVIDEWHNTLPLPPPIEGGEKFLPLDGGGLRRGWVKRVIIHAEIEHSLEPIIAKIKSYGWEAGVALNPETPWEKIDALVSMLDIVLVMTVHPGKSGQSFGDAVASFHLLNKILELHEAHPELTISIDGGVNTDTIPLLLEAGATRLIVGSAIFSQKDPLAAFQKLQQILNPKS